MTLMPGPDQDEHARRWDGKTLRNPHLQPDKAARVESMFNAIARTYERFNTIATWGRDAAWRRAAVTAAGVRDGEVVLDVCCGTGDMLRAFLATTTARMLIGVDFAAGMLARAWGTTDEPGRTFLLRADALRLPLADGSIDVISCVFGVRNFDRLEVGLAEMYRVARPGARLVILEFAQPVNILARWAYRAYCNMLLPWLGAVISRERAGAYRYLPRSIDTFLSCSAVVDAVTRAGFAAACARPLNFGGVALFCARK